MFGKSGASAKNSIWSVALTQRYKQKQLSSNLNIVVRTRCGDRLFYVARRSTGLSSFALKGTPASIERFATTPAILDLGRTGDNAPHIAEG